MSSFGASGDALGLLEEPVVSGLPERLVDRAQQLAGCPVALYVIDIDGSRLHRVCGGERLPDEVVVGSWFVGPEISWREMLDLGAALPEGVGPGCVAPLWLRGRAIALLVCERAPRLSLAEFARGAAAAVELADRYTDVFASARRRRHTNPAAEIQQVLLPPRIARVNGAELAGTIVPAYDVGGDWFDHCATPGGAWLAVADAVGKGNRAAALSAAAVGAYRAARRSQHTLQTAVREMHQTVVALPPPEAFMTAIVASWEADSHTFCWIRCGHPKPLLWHPDGHLEPLEGSDGPPLGIAGGDFEPTVQLAERRLTEGQRIVLVSDGVTERRTDDRALFGLKGVAAALATAPDLPAPAVVSALLQALAAAGSQPPCDDATVLVLAPMA